MVDRAFTSSTLGSNIATGLSTQIIIQVGTVPVGAVQNLTVNQTRNVQGVAEVGTDGFIEKVPNQPTDVTLNLTRVVFDGLRLPVAFGRAFFNIQAQRFPFDITVFDNSNAISDGLTGSPAVEQEPLNQIVHTYRNCWFTNLTTPYTSDNYIITETATISAEFARTVTTGDISAVPAGDPRIQELSEAGINVERASDVGRRGSLDAAGLARITGFDTGN